MKFALLTLFIVQLFIVFSVGEKPADTLASLNLEKAEAPLLPICLHDVKPATGY